MHAASKTIALNSVMTALGLTIVLIQYTPLESKVLPCARTADSGKSTELAQALVNDSVSRHPNRGTLRGGFVFAGDPPQPEVLQEFPINELSGSLTIYDESLLVNPKNK